MSEEHGGDEGKVVPISEYAASKLDLGVRADEAGMSPVDQFAYEQRQLGYRPYVPGERPDWVQAAAKAAKLAKLALIGLGIVKAAELIGDQWRAHHER